jgi:hypothetical protein
MLNDEQVSLLKSIIVRLGFKCVKGSYYHLNSGTKTKTIKNLISEMGLDVAMNSEPALAEFALPLFKTGAIPNFDFNALLKQISDEGASERKNFDTLDSSELSHWEKEYKKYVPILLSKEAPKDALRLIDMERQCLAEDIHPEMWVARKGLVYDEVIRDPSIPTVIPKFMPYEMDLLVTEESLGLKRTYLNTYIPPLWRKVKAEPKLGGIIKIIFEHLFPIEEDREYVYDWFHHLITSRNGTMLCLVGARGTGKGVVSKDIARALVGKNNTDIVGQSILRDKFNAAFDSKRLIFFDEVELEQDGDLAKIKAFCNDVIALEKKGKDSYTADNFASLILSTNNRMNFKVEPQERRFSVPRVSEENLKTKLSEAVIGEFSQRCLDPYSPEIAEFGEWLLKRVPTYSNQTPYKGEYFFEICDMSLTGWKSFLIGLLEKADEPTSLFSVKEMTSKFKKKDSQGPAHLNTSTSRFPAYKPKVAEFLYQYRYRGEFRLGDIVDIYDSEGKAVSWGVQVNRHLWEHLNEKKAEDLL